MLKQLSGYNDDQLAYLLSRVREIALLGDEAALIETDKFAWEIMDGEVAGGIPELPVDYDTFEYYHQNRLRRLQSSLTAAREKIQTKTLARWDASSLDNQLRLEIYAQSQRPETDESWESFRSECAAFLEEAWQAILMETLEKCAMWEFKNISSVVSMLSELKSVQDEYKAHKPLTDEIERKIREVKKRGAQFRFNKKVGDARVAQSAGYFGKAEGLTKEAAAMLAQDWAMVFPDEVPPKAQELIQP